MSIKSAAGINSLRDVGEGFFSGSQSGPCEIIWDYESPKDRRLGPPRTLRGNSTADCQSNNIDRDLRSQSVKRHLKVTPKRSKSHSDSANKKHGKLSGDVLGGKSQGTLLSLHRSSQGNKERGPISRGLFFKCDLGEKDESLAEDGDNGLSAEETDDMLLALSPIVNLEKAIAAKKESAANDNNNSLPDTELSINTSTSHISPLPVSKLNVDNSKSMIKTPSEQHHLNNSVIRTPTDDQKMNQSFSCRASVAAASPKAESFSDDDFFNESVIQSTQAIEEALYDKDKNKFVSPANVKSVLSKVGLLSNNSSGDDRSPRPRRNCATPRRKLSTPISAKHKDSSSNGGVRKRILRNIPETVVSDLKTPSQVGSITSNPKKDQPRNTLDKCPKCFRTVASSGSSAAKTTIISSNSCPCTVNNKQTNSSSNSSKSNKQSLNYSTSSNIQANLNNNQISKTNPLSKYPNKSSPITTNCKETTPVPSTNASSQQSSLPSVDNDAMFDDFDDWDFVSQVEEDFISSQQPPKPNVNPSSSQSSLFKPNSAAKSTNIKQEASLFTSNSIAKSTSIKQNSSVFTSNSAAKSTNINTNTSGFKPNSTAKSTNIKPNISVPKNPAVVLQGPSSITNAKSSAGNTHLSSTNTTTSSAIMSKIAPNASKTNIGQSSSSVSSVLSMNSRSNSSMSLRSSSSQKFTFTRTPSTGVIPSNNHSNLNPVNANTDLEKVVSDYHDIAKQFNFNNSETNSSLISQNIRSNAPNASNLGSNTSKGVTRASNNGYISTSNTIGAYPKTIPSSSTTSLAKPIPPAVKVPPVASAGPVRCTAEEIAKKKAQALARRQAVLKQAKK